MSQNAKKQVCAPPHDHRALPDKLATTGLCTGCAACVVTCKLLADEMLAYNFEGDTLSVETTQETCRECGLCFALCPRFDFPAGTGQAPVKKGQYLGECQQMLLVRPAGAVLQTAPAETGVVAALLGHLVDIHYLDGAILPVSQVSKDSDFKVARTREEITAVATEKLVVSPSLLALEDMFRGEDDHRYLGYNDQKFAFVGTPCMVDAVSNMQSLQLDIVRKLKLKVGFSCLAAKRVVGGKSVQRESCKVCLDLPAFQSDFSVTTLGAPKGYAMVLVRTGIGSEVVKLALQGKALETFAEEGVSADEVYAKARKVLTNAAQRKTTNNEKNLKSKE